ncbi:MAG: DUF3108 domain-containing protein [Pseudazoarcus pumilus]|nr:DUF3108 domain-containing protein [Pseudazoarcus pumilus]
MKSFWRVLAMCCVMVSMPVAAAGVKWPAGGEVVFDITQGEGGMVIGKGVHRWQHDGRGYRMSTLLETTGLAALLKDFEYTQRSEGDVTPQGLVPRSFVVEQKGRETETATFDWRSNSVLVERSKGRRETETLARGDLDVLSAWHLASVRPGRELPREITLVSNRGADPAAVEVVGMQDISLPVGKLRALHVRLKAHSGKLDIGLWLSEQHGWAPVRVRLQDRKGKVLDHQAVSVKLTAAADQR